MLLKAFILTALIGAAMLGGGKEYISQKAKADTGYQAGISVPCGGCERDEYETSGANLVCYNSAQNGLMSDGRYTALKAGLDGVLEELAAGGSEEAEAELNKLWGKISVMSGKACMTFEREDGRTEDVSGRIDALDKVNYDSQNILTPPSAREKLYPQKIESWIMHDMQIYFQYLAAVQTQSNLV